VPWTQNPLRLWPIPKNLFLPNGIATKGKGDDIHPISSLLKSLDLQDLSHRAPCHFLKTVDVINPCIAISKTR
jgi:hypothetical protein